MKRDINRLAKEKFDVLIIGGGINGAAIANIASLNGLSVALVEKNDFGSGTSSKSSKLLHGGLRYLENLEFSLVKEALKERTIQLHNAPHLTKALAFIIPVYKGDRRPLWMMKWGVALYDFLSGKYCIEKHKELSAEEIIRFIPTIKMEDLIGGVMYYDAQMDDARLVLENVLQAAYQGACVANYTEVKKYINEVGKTVGVQVIDSLTGKKFDVRAKKTVCAVGPWTNSFLAKERGQTPQKVRTTKGIHIVYPGQLSEHALLIPIEADRRIFFIIPWMGNSLIGTTDTDFTDNPDNVSVEEEDIDYLFDALKRVLPNIDFEKSKIIKSTAGLRPLVYSEGNPSKISRKHVIEETYSGVLYVMGGKYTTYRKIAQDCVSRLTKKDLINTEKIFPVYGGGEIKDSIEQLSKEYRVNIDIIINLMNFYGTRYRDILEIIREDASLKNRLCTYSNVIGAQVVYAVENEMACRVDDITRRRLPLQFETAKKEEYAPEVQDLLSKYK